MENVIEFKTAEKPMYYSKSGFPYSKLIHAMDALRGSTKCVILEDKEISSNQITHLRNICKKSGLGRVKAARIEKRWHLWLE